MGIHTKTRDRVHDLGEVFTPIPIVNQMLDLLPQSYWSDEGITFFEPSCGNGNIVAVILERRIAGLGCKQKAVETLIAIDIDQENVDETRARVIELVGTEHAETVYKNITRNDCLSALHQGPGLPKNMTKLGSQFVKEHGVKKLFKSECPLEGELFQVDCP